MASSPWTASSNLSLTLRSALSVSAASSTAAPSSSDSITAHVRLALTVTHLALVAIGSVNLLVIILVVLRPRYMRSITNVYMVGLCLADFIYLANLTLVAATQLLGAWPFGALACTIYHGSETTGKYASVLFVVLLAADRYCAMCRAGWCARFRSYRTAMITSFLAWVTAVLFALPLFIYANYDVPEFLRDHPIKRKTKICYANWPNSDVARLYISISSIVIFALPLVLIVFCYYHILNKLRDAVKGSKRLKRASSTRAPYHRVTRLVLWVVIFHVICWSPFWFFNLFSSILRIRIISQFERIVVNIIHLFPYINCALNPLLYAVHAENFQLAFKSLFCCPSNASSALSLRCNLDRPSSKIAPERGGLEELDRPQNATRSTYFRNSQSVELESLNIVAACVPPSGKVSTFAIIREPSMLIDVPEESAGRAQSESLHRPAGSFLSAASGELERPLSAGKIRDRDRRPSARHRLPVDTSTWRKYSDIDSEHCSLRAAAAAAVAAAARRRASHAAGGNESGGERLLRRPDLALISEPRAGDTTL